MANFDLKETVQTFFQDENGKMVNVEHYMNMSYRR